MSESPPPQLTDAEIQAASAFVTDLKAAASRVIVGQEHMMERLLIGLLARGHVLLEGLPGLAKTLAIKTLSTLVKADFNRIQFTPDLLPADVVGTMIYEPATQAFSVRKGPIFANFILADEINRAPAKVQSALLEAMQERQVTIGGETFSLAEPFLVLATQNPIDQEGTYALPEAQADRFMLKVKIDYPEKEEEREILRRNLAPAGWEKVAPVTDLDRVLKARKMVQRVYLDPKIEQYIIDIVFATRQPNDYKIPKLKHWLDYGASPRATINLARAARALAFLRQRNYVIPEDIRALAPDVLRHRLGRSYEAEAEQISAGQIITTILNKVPVP
ncbi:MAG: AAA family ATPase [Bacteroidota bacterium]